MSIPLHTILHIPKTGGSTLRYYVTRHLPAGTVLELYNNESPDEVKQRIAAFDPLLRACVGVVIGHDVFYGIHDCFDRPAQYYTMLREPLSRMQSAFNYHVDTGRLSPPHRANAEQEFASFFSSNRPANVINRFLVKRGFLNESVEHAKSDISSYFEECCRRFHFIGLTERSPHDFRFILGRCGVTPWYIARKNRTHYTNHLSLNATIREQFLQHHSLDDALYRYVLSRQAI